jgi:hypothetical protein
MPPYLQLLAINSRFTGAVFYYGILMSWALKKLRMSLQVAETLISNKPSLLLDHNVEKAYRITNVIQRAVQRLNTSIGIMLLGEYSVLVMTITLYVYMQTNVLSLGNSLLAMDNLPEIISVLLRVLAAVDLNLSAQSLVDKVGNQEYIVLPFYDVV